MSYFDIGLSPERTFEVDLNCTSFKETNLTLRSIWSAIRKEYGRLGWHYVGYRDGKNKAYLIGDAAFGDFQYFIGLRYDRKDVAIAVIFTAQSKADDNENLRRIVQSAIKNQSRDRFFSSARLRWSLGSAKIQQYGTDECSIWSPNPGEIELGLITTAFDGADAVSELLERLNPIVDILSAATNSAFELEQVIAPIQISDEIFDSSETTIRDEDWLEGHGAEGDLIFLTAGCWSRIKEIQATEHHWSDDISRAARHFHDGIRLYHDKKRRFISTSLSLFISSLESLTNLVQSPRETCSNCGQTKYSIKQRVRDLVTRMLGPHAEKLIAKQYDLRSAYLHTGTVNSHLPAGIKLRPLLDPFSPTGMTRSYAADDPHVLLEFTGHAIRKALRDNVR